MELDNLLRRDRDAAALFSRLPYDVQTIIRQRAGNISTLAALRDYTVHAQDCTCMDPELKAEWTMEHET